MKITRKKIKIMILESLEKAISKNTKQYHDLYVDNLDKDFLNKNDYEFSMRDEKIEAQPDLSNYEHEEIPDSIVEYFINELLSRTTRKSSEGHPRISLSFTFIQTLKVAIPANISEYFNRDSPSLKKFHQIKASYLTKLCKDASSVDSSDLSSLVKFILFNFVKTRNARNNQESAVKGTEVISTIIKNCLTKSSKKTPNALESNAIEESFYKELKSLKVLTPAFVRFNAYEEDINDQIKDLFHISHRVKESPSKSSKRYQITLSKIFAILEDSLISSEIKKSLINTIINHIYSITLGSGTDYFLEIRESIQTIIIKYKSILKS